MNIQIFGTNKCFDTKKAQRWFKERNIKFQFIDTKKYGMSEGELKNVVQVLGLDAVIDENNKNYAELKYLAYDEDKFYKLLDNQDLLKTPIVRNGKKATSGFKPEIWQTWE